MAPYEALYGRKCRSPVHWKSTMSSPFPKLDLVQEAIDKVQIIRERIRTAQSHQKSYANQRRKDLEFATGEEVFLRLSRLKGKIHSRKGGKLSLRYIGLFKITERIGTVAYRLELPPKLVGMHNVFHVSRLKKYHPDPEHIIKDNIPQVMENLTYEEKPLQIIDHQVRELRNKSISLVKVVWQNHDKLEEATWETEEEMRKHYPELFPQENLETKFF
ncbi:hypothetical protein DH2020_022165 [Rehmannia glutinosa]|uniref:Tf2-1-like SH3-like domain-containing protein n=1 Tax=Rehmannia glutinosa TaxID=99300 RepID=A0ABR0WGR9_REHGL